MVLFSYFAHFLCNIYTFFCKFYNCKFALFLVKCILFFYLFCTIHFTLFMKIQYSSVKLHFFIIWNFLCWICTFSVKITLFLNAIISVGFCYLANVRQYIQLSLWVIEYIKTRKIKTTWNKLWLVKRPEYCRPETKHNPFINQFKQRHTFISAFNLFLPGSNHRHYVL